jgi:hypothetical protein
MSPKNSFCSSEEVPWQSAEPFAIARSRLLFSNQIAAKYTHAIAAEKHKNDMLMMYPFR